MNFFFGLVFSIALVGYGVFLFKKIYIIKKHNIKLKGKICDISKPLIVGKYRAVFEKSAKVFNKPEFLPLVIYHYGSRTYHKVPVYSQFIYKKQVGEDIDIIINPDHPQICFYKLPKGYFSSVLLILFGSFCFYLNIINNL